MTTHYNSNLELAQEISRRLGTSPIPFESIMSLAYSIYQELGGDEENFNDVYNILLAIHPLVEGVVDDISALQVAVSGLTLEMATKQNILEAGSNIQISGDTISATDTTYTASDFDIKDLADSTDLREKWNNKQNALTAGSNIQISSDTISAVGYTYDTTKGSITNVAKPDTSGQSPVIYTNTSTGLNSVCLGQNNTVTGEASATLGGQDITVNGDVSVGLGGYSNSISGSYSVIAGGQDNTATKSNCFVTGIKNNATGTGSVAMGRYCDSQGQYSLAIGYGNSSNHTTAEGNGTVSIGTGSHAKNQYSIAIGSSSNYRNLATEGDWSVAIGTALSTKNYQEVAVGANNVSHHRNNSTGDAGNTAYSVGCASSLQTSDAANSLEIMQNKDTYVYGVGGYDGKHIKTDTGYESTKTLQDVIADKQDTLTAGDNIQISGNTISVVNLINDLVSSANSTYSSSKIFELISNLNQFNIQVVNELPATGQTHTLYFVPVSDATEPDTMDEYMWINNSWELVGTTRIDLSDYYTSAQVDTLLGNKQNTLIAGTGISISGDTISSSIINDDATSYSSTWSSNKISSSIDEGYGILSDVTSVTLDCNRKSYSIAINSNTTINLIIGGRYKNFKLFIFNNSDSSNSYTIGGDTDSFTGSLARYSGILFDVTLVDRNGALKLLCSPETLTPSTGINLDSAGNISVDTNTIQSKLTAGDNIQISGNTISATYSNATQSASGLMSSTDKIKLDGLNNYTLPAATSNSLGGVKIGSGISVDSGVISVDSTTVQSKLTAGSNIQISGNTISATDTTYQASDFDIKDLADSTDLRQQWSNKQNKISSNSSIYITSGPIGDYCLNVNGFSSISHTTYYPIINIGGRDEYGFFGSIVPYSLNTGFIELIGEPDTLTYNYTGYTSETISEFETLMSSVMSDTTYKNKYIMVDVNDAPLKINTWNSTDKTITLDNTIDALFPVRAKLGNIVKVNNSSTVSQKFYYDYDGKPWNEVLIDYDLYNKINFYEGKTLCMNFGDYGWRVVGGASVRYEVGGGVSYYLDTNAIISNQPVDDIPVGDVFIYHDIPSVEQIGGIGIGQSLEVNNSYEIAMGFNNKSSNGTEFSIGSMGANLRENVLEVNNGKLYVRNIGGYNGTNPTGTNVKSLNEKIAELEQRITTLGG